MSMNSRRAEHFVETLLHPAIERSRTWMVKAYLRWGLNQAWSSTTLYASIFFSVYLGHSLLTLSPQIVVHSVIGALFLVGPLSFLVNAGLQVGLGKASLRHLEKVGVDLQSEINLTDATKRETAHRGEAWRHIHASQVVYQYPSETDSKHIIGPLNLSISRGEMLFLSGGNGSGKSTLLLLLCSLLAPTGGQVFIDGRPVQDELISYRSRFAGVFGDFFLFSHVIDAAGNLTPDHQVEALLKQLHLSTQVEVKQGKLSRLTLSTGQRKRLALLQCYAEDREICFFDEWAADQDQHFREYFYCVLLPELKSRGKTVLVISHDDRYFHLADRVIKLEGGLIVSGDAPIPEVPLWNASTANI
jgi:putative ATP-binding cassette transporter